MFSITLKLKQALVALAVAAGLFVGAGPANAACYAKFDDVDGAIVSRDTGARVNPDRATQALSGNFGDTSGLNGGDMSF
jgi:hypothetical protein